jgi:hypothetical protein
LYADFNGTRFVENYVVDDVDPTKEGVADEQLDQSQALLLRDFVGELHIDNLSIENVRGIVNSEVLESLLSGNLPEDEYGFKGRLLGLYKFRISQLVNKNLTFIDVRGYNYTGDGLNAVRPKLFHLDESDYNDFRQNDPPTGLTIKSSKIVNADCMVEFFQSSEYLFEGFMLHDNGDEGIGAESIIKIQFKSSDLINLAGWDVQNNDLGDATVIWFDLLEETSTSSAPLIRISEYSLFKNNRSKKKSALFVLEDMPWMWVAIQNSTFDNNFGTIVNDIYLKNVMRYDFNESFWYQSPEEHQIPVNEDDQNQAKFVLMNGETGRFELNVIKSEFDCRIPFRPDYLYREIDTSYDPEYFTLDNMGTETTDDDIVVPYYWFEASLFNLSYPFSNLTKTEYDYDLRTYKFTIDP